MEITVTKAGIEHSKRIAEFQQKMALETEDYPLDSITVNKGVEAVFKDPSKGTYYVAIHNDEVIACLLTTTEWSDWRNGIIVWIQSLYVVSEHRNEGVFKKMYSFLKNKVENDKNLMGIRLYVDNTNKKAIEVYKAIGMDCEHYRMFEWMKL